MSIISEQLYQINDDVEQKEQQIRNLMSKLSSTESDIGDWKIAKCMEYQSLGLEVPYDLNELHVERQLVRDKINQLQEEINDLKSKI